MPPIASKAKTARVIKKLAMELARMGTANRWMMVQIMTLVDTTNE